jgi:hypothetical protein
MELFEWLAGALALITPALVVYEVTLHPLS